MYVSGYVYDTNGRPLAGVYVSTEDAYEIHQDETDSYGYYAFYDIRKQIYIIKYEKNNYQTQIKEADLTSIPDFETPKFEKVVMEDFGLTGTWSGTYEIPEQNYSDNLTMELNQKGDEISGNVSLSNGCTGTITGVFDGSILTFKIIGENTNYRCRSKWQGTAIIACTQDHMLMTFSIDTRRGKMVGSGELWKQ